MESAAAIPPTTGTSKRPSAAERVAVVMITRNARARVGRSLARLTGLPEAPDVLVVDNASSDGTPEVIRRGFPGVSVVELEENLGAAARNVGVRQLDAPYVAFAEDDSWYEPGALTAAAELLDAHPGVALINAHVLVGAAGRPEPLHADMVDTPLPERRPGLPGHRILSFLEGVSVVRREAFSAVGGFDRRLGGAGPEEHLAADLLARGWELRYVPSVRARHVPDHRTPSAEMRRLGVRNTLWFAWTRRPPRPALRWTAHVVRSSPANRTTLLGVLDALRWLPRALAERRPLPTTVEADMARLDEQKMRSSARSYG
jgi:GT2 family glycosyltransferase